MKNTGGPAFPVDPFIASRPGTEAVAKRLAEGMTLRDYFAAASIQGLVANPQNRGSARFLAEAAFSMADAMLEAREAS